MSHNLKRVPLSTLLPILLLLSLYAQNNDFKFDRLDSPPVFAIIQDKEDFIWLGSQVGLIRYDGFQFITYETIPFDSTSLSSVWITSLFEDTSGNLWIGTTGGGLNCFNKYTEKFSHFLHDPADANSLSSDQLFVIYPDRDGSIWIGTGGWETSQGGGLNKFDPITKEFTSFRHKPTDPFSISSDLLCSLLIDHSGLFWIGTADKGINVVPVTDLIKYRPGGKNASPQFVKYQHNPQNNYSPANNFILSMMEDKTGSIWFGTREGGVFFLDHHKQNFYHYHHEPNNPNSLSSNYIWCCLEDGQGNLWFGHDQEGIDCYDSKKKRYLHYRHDPANANSLISNQINTLYQDRQGILWIGTYNGLDSFNPKTGLFTHYINDPNNPFNLSSNLVMQVLEDRTGKLWIATILGGLNLFDRKSKQFKCFKNDPSDPGSIGGNVVMTLYEDSDGVLWIGTQGYGLSKMIWENPDKPIFKNYSYNPHDPNSLSYNTIFAITESKVHEKNVLWIGTFGGLNRFDKKTEKFTYFSHKDGMPDSKVTGILEDRLGYLWISMVHGFARFDPLTKSFKIYDLGDGLPFNKFNGSSNTSHFISKNGELFFCGQGVLYFHPDLIKDNPDKPAVRFTDFKIFNESVRLDTSLTFIKQIKLSHRQNIFSFRFAALNYTNPQKNQYAYKMEGFQDDWISNGTENSATFTNLNPGEYTFRVKGSNNDGIWNEEGVSLKLIITPPFWQTGWFRLLIFLFITALVYGGYRYRLNRALELERIRIQIASDLHDDIGSNLTKIAVHSEIIQTTNKPDNIIHSSQKIGSMSREIIGTLSDIVWSIDARNDTVGDLIDRMRDFLEAVFQPGTLQIDFQTRGLHVQQKINQKLRQNIYLIFKEAVNNAVRHAEASQIHIHLTNGDGKFHMKIPDDGTGVDMSRSYGGHHGLENMKLRAGRIGGELTIENNQGTQVMLTLDAL